MYSMVMMMAVASSGDTASFHWRSGGCFGSFARPIVMRSAPMTYSEGSYGMPRYLNRGWGWRGRHSGYSGYATYSSGCVGASCFGSCFGNSMAYDSGFYSSGFESSPSYHSAPIEYPSFGSPSMGWSSGGDCFSAVPVQPAVPTVRAIVEKPATITVELPTGSQLYVDGQLVAGTGTSRSFATPSLATGRAFYYDMKAIVTVDGESLTEDLKIVVHSGDTVQKSFGQLIAAVSKREKTQLASK